MIEVFLWELTGSNRRPSACKYFLPFTLFNLILLHFT